MLFYIQLFLASIIGGATVFLFIQNLLKKKLKNFEPEIPQISIPINVVLGLSIDRIKFLAENQPEAGQLLAPQLLIDNNLIQFDDLDNHISSYAEDCFIDMIEVPWGEVISIAGLTNDEISLSDPNNDYVEVKTYNLENNYKRFNIKVKMNPSANRTFKLIMKRAGNIIGSPIEFHLHSNGHINVPINISGL